MALQRIYFCKKFATFLPSSFLNIGKSSLLCNETLPTACPVVNPSKYLSTTSCFLSEKKYEKPGFKVTKVVTEDGVLEVKKKIYQERLTLIGPDDDLQVVTMEEAKKIALRRNLKLFKITDRDPKSGRATYKLLSFAEFAEESKKQKSQKGGDTKEEKLLNINSKIAAHDLQSKIKHVTKWLEKEYSIRVVISGDSQNYAPAEKIFDAISEAVKDSGRVVQKLLKHGEIKFSIIQPKKQKVKPAKTDTEPPKAETPTVDN